MPKEKLEQWEEDRQAWLKCHHEPWDFSTEREYHQRFSNRLDEWLDAGHGMCALKQPAIRKIVSNALTYFDTVRYDLTSYVIMPNHVHVILKLHVEHKLADILHAWKSFTAKAINSELKRTGTLWQPEYWDRLIRNERHLSACLSYIRDNPVKAHLGQNSYTLWDGSAAVPVASLCGQDARAPVIASAVQPQEGSVAVPAASRCGQDARAPVVASAVQPHNGSSCYVNFKRGGE
jgi:REP element-mobilizing transposase RayT